MLVQPDRVGILADEFFGVHAVDGGRAADADLLAVHEDRHEVLLALFFGGALGGGEFLFWFGHWISNRHGAPQVEASEDGEIIGVEGPDFGDAGAVPGGGDEGIEESFAPEMVAGEPVEPGAGHGGILSQQGNFGGVGPEMRIGKGVCHAQGLGKAPGIGDHMDEFRQDTRRESEGSSLAGRVPGQQPASTMSGMLRDGPGDEKPAVETDHVRIRGRGNLPTFPPGSSMVSGWRPPKPAAAGMRGWAGIPPRRRSAPSRGWPPG